MAKVGRNERCPCGSGKKYKHCHGSAQHIEQATAQARTISARADAQRVQRQRQQGLGRPIISTEANGHRFVAVKNRLLHSKRWRTFHDFLSEYIRAAMGVGWGEAEIKKPVELRHPVIKWFELCGEQVKLSTSVVDGIHTGMMTGAFAAYLHLAYDLYELENNAELQAKLLGRLRNHEEFSSARYEVFVAATFIRAGFDIVFENEDDRENTHCEFTATNRRTGRKFSVEAKRRESSDFRIVRLLNNALGKKADHDRVVFIDLNYPESFERAQSAQPMNRALKHLRTGEDKPLNGQVRPPAYVFVTNTPWEHFLELPEPSCSALAEGFRIPDFKGDGVAHSLRDAINAREAHIEMHELMLSIKDHAEIPVTFDGDIPEYAFNPELPRLLIGQYYMVQHPDGDMRRAKLTTATVAETEKLAHCAMLFDDDCATIHTMPLSDAEMAAWRRHPDTFFGEVGQRQTHIDHPLQLYDFIHASYKNTSKKRLLEVMEGAPDLTDLASLDQQQLASIFAERTTMNALAMQKQSAQGVVDDGGERPDDVVPPAPATL